MCSVLMSSLVIHAETAADHVIREGGGPEFRRVVRDSQCGTPPADSAGLG